MSRARAWLARIPRGWLWRPAPPQPARSPAWRWVENRPHIGYRELTVDERQERPEPGTAPRPRWLTRGYKPQHRIGDYS